ncbi:Putative 8-amino-7-oxononanoate synthase [Cytospora mali]|uniref:8-amino-7-oxononanoate synthase n=1 Tax=Cytospora mali TaxID=578113 RepID=A0A194W816_CYTMA|nr:Putative 8-amino-7-oxononanoate synthase [Valsa mali]
MADASILAEWFPESRKAQPKANGNGVNGKHTDSIFYRNLEERLEARWSELRAPYQLRRNEPAPKSKDFSTLDYLGLSHSGLIRERFLEELKAHPDFRLGAGGSRLLNGNSPYIDALERDIATFHGTETALLFNSGFEANVAFFEAVPRSGDAIVYEFLSTTLLSSYDELVHASLHEGMQGSNAACKRSFKHNDVDNFREVLVDVRNSEPLIRQGQRTVIVAVETIYSMDGDVAPLLELVRVAKEVFPDGTAQFFVDEAHTSGVRGREGRGLVEELGLTHEVAVQMHTYGKAVGCGGGTILARPAVREILVNFARGFIYTTAPPFPMLAAIRSGYELMISGKTQPLQDRIQHLVKHFFLTLQAHPDWEEASDAGMLKMLTMDGWEDRQVLSQVVPFMTRQRYTLYLCWHLQLKGYNCFPIEYPVVPRGESRLRVAFHAHNNEAEVEGLATAACEWAREMMDIEDSGDRGRLPQAARQVIAALRATGTSDL